MSGAIKLRSDYDAQCVRGLAGRYRDAKQSRRLLSIAAIYDGMRRCDAAKIGGMDRQILRDWVVRFNEDGPDGLVDRNPALPRLRLPRPLWAQKRT